MTVRPKAWARDTAPNNVATFLMPLLTVRLADTTGTVVIAGGPHLELIVKATTLLQGDHLDPKNLAKVRPAQNPHLAIEGVKFEEVRVDHEAGGLCRKQHRNIALSKLGETDLIICLLRLD